jgi:hypothetical protein
VETPCPLITNTSHNIVNPKDTMLIEEARQKSDTLYDFIYVKNMYKDSIYVENS